MSEMVNPWASTNVPLIWFNFALFHNLLCQFVNVEVEQEVPNPVVLEETLIQLVAFNCNEEGLNHFHEQRRRDSFQK
jgi:hypothetical protein